ncbi:hypothetical protein UVI_02008280 [Ustilaginoidea virens]|uniref:Amidohydrolase-related domain-containing protein n=1 Tax=Ustilaginoidea virens TaxID=1159556 RepID=A0A1B5L7S4_USTVR|nr:hypothetical protein UVI_02008280 [Ustilaginoidea virens]
MTVRKVQSAVSASTPAPAPSTSQSGSVARIADSDTTRVGTVPERLTKPWKKGPQWTWVLRNANIVDPGSGSVHRNQDVKLSGGLVEAIADEIAAGSQDFVLDLEGRYVCPGLIDCHVHLSSVAGNPSLSGALSASDPAASYFRQPFLCKQILDRGFTSVRDVGGATLALKEAIEDDVFPGPRVVIANKALSQTGGHGDIRDSHDTQRCCGGDTILSKVVDGVPGCIQAAREQFRTGADFIKIMAGGGIASPNDKLESTQFTAAEIRAIVEVADTYGSYVTAHAYTPKAIRHAVDNGVKGIEHGNFIDRDTARHLASRGVWLTPTLVTYEALGSGKYAGFLPPANRAKNEEVLKRGLESLRTAHEAGVAICHGSDLLGPLHEEQSNEFRIRARALGNVAVLQGATVNAARLLRQDKFLGQVREGFAADLLILGRNPLEDVTVLSEPEKTVLGVFKNGRVYKSRWSRLPEDGMLVAGRG